MWYSSSYIVVNARQSPHGWKNVVLQMDSENSMNGASKKWESLKENVKKYNTQNLEEVFEIPWTHNEGGCLENVTLKDDIEGKNR